MDKNILNNVIIEWNNSDFNDSGLLKASEITNRMKYQLVYTLNAPRKITIFNGNSDMGKKFKDKVYINGEHVKLDEKGKTLNLYNPGEYQVYIDGFDKINKTSFCAFDHCFDLTSVIIPNSVTKIDFYSFERCRYLTSVTLGDSVTLIGDWAFVDCVSLTEITIPSSVKVIGYAAFEGCKNLKTIYVEDIDKFNEIKFTDEWGSNPTYYGAKLVKLQK